jgi:hypothetical protein
VLEGADMQQMLDVYVAMKRSLETLTRVPEFSGVADKAAVLEARLKEMAVPQLAAAIRNQEGACCRAGYQDAKPCAAACSCHSESGRCAPQRAMHVATKK